MIETLRSPTGHVTLFQGDAKERFRTILKNAARFPAYQEHFHRSGISSELLSVASIETILSRLEPFDKNGYMRLQEDSLRLQQSNHFTTDWTSGSTAKPILKFTSQGDEEAEAEAVRRAFRGVGLTRKDRVVCYDVGASDIYLFYARVLNEIGLRGACFVKALSNYNRSIETLLRLEPSAIISVPSVLRHSVDALISQKGKGRKWLVKKIIYIGEPMERALRTKIQEQLGARCYSFYGTTEIGSIGIECAQSQGIHIPTDILVPTLLPHNESRKSVRRVSSTRSEGILAWTSLRFKDQPVVMYRVNDLAEIDVAPCKCGDLTPRMYFRGRVDHTFFLFGITFTYDLFLTTVQRVLSAPAHLELRIQRSSGHDSRNADRLILILDAKYRSHIHDCYNRILAIHPIQDFVERNLLEVSFRCVSSGYFFRRKTRRLAND